MLDLELTEANNGQAFTVQHGAVIVIRLAENPTTGYRWGIDQAGDALGAPQSSNFEGASSTPGAGGTRVFTFQVPQVGRAALRLKLWREWEGDTSIQHRFQVTIEST